MNDIEVEVGFKITSKQYYILHAGMNQRARIFGDSANRQCTAMCAIAIATASVLDPYRWKVNTINQVMLHGNQYYNVNKLTIFK